MSPFDLTIIGIVAMLTLAFAVVFFVVLYQRKMMRHQAEIKKIQDRQQLELIQASIRAEEDERMRIAAELHDDVGATLSSVRLFLYAATEADADKSIILESKDLLDDSINKIRNISHKLQPALLLQLGLHAALQSFAIMISKPGNVAMNYNSDALPRLHEDIELSIYRIVQELTSNIIRHAAATIIEIHTDILAAQLRTTMLHDGNGLTDETYQMHIYKKGSIGLKNIVNRLKSINATIGFGQVSEGNYTVTILAPIPTS